MGKLKLSQISYPVVHCENTYISTSEGQGSISCGQYLDRTLGKFPPLYGPHLFPNDQVQLRDATQSPGKSAIFNSLKIGEKGGR